MTIKFLEKLFWLSVVMLISAGCAFGWAIGLSGGRAGDTRLTTITSTNYEVLSNISIFSGNSETIAVMMITLVLMTLIVLRHRSQ